LKGKGLLIWICWWWTFAAYFDPFDQLLIFDIPSFDHLQYCSAGIIPARIQRNTVVELRSSILAASVKVTSPRSAHSPST
jgi:hypothetical protein